MTAAVIGDRIVETVAEAARKKTADGDGFTHCLGLREAHGVAQFIFFGISTVGFMLPFDVNR